MKQKVLAKLNSLNLPEIDERLEPVCLNTDDGLDLELMGKMAEATHGRYKGQSLGDPPDTQIFVDTEGVWREPQGFEKDVLCNFGLETAQAVTDAGREAVQKIEMSSLYGQMGRQSGKTLMAHEMRRRLAEKFEMTVLDSVGEIVEEPAKPSPPKPPHKDRGLEALSRRTGTQFTFRKSNVKKKRKKRK